jgi:uncharacterized membrane protein
MRPLAPQMTPLPPADPPADDVLELLDRLATFRGHLTDAERQVHMLEQTVREEGEQLPAGSRTYYRIEVRIARNRLMHWTREVRALERAARAKGLQP